MFAPKFTITNNLLTYLTSLEAAKSLIDHAPLVPAWEARFRDEAIQRTVHFGTKIEGNDLSKEQVDRLVQLPVNMNSQELAAQAGIVARDRDIQEVINYRNVIQWIDARQETELIKIFNEETLKKLHHLTMSRLLDESQIGIYRKQQVVVKGVSLGNTVFKPPLSLEVPFLIKDFFNWYQDEKTIIHPVLRAAITHYQLVFIHPFIEGNGRTARAMATLSLYVFGYDFKKFFSLEQYFDSDVESYYKALLSVQESKTNDLTYWLEYFCYGLAIEIDKVKQQVLKLSKDLKLKKELGKQVALSERQIILLELLQNQGEITSDDAQKILPHISVDTILRDIKDLIQKGVIKKHGVTKGVHYTLS